MSKMNLGELQKERCALLVVDIQEKLFQVMSERELILVNSLRLISGIKEFGIPVIVTEQYPSGIGKTINPILSELRDDYKPLSKVEFSCFDNEGFKNAIDKLDGIDSLIMIGIEAHVCIFQTTMAALKDDYSVHLVTDAVSSRTIYNKKIGIERCVNMGAHISTTEMILFQLVQQAGTEDFKKIIKLVK